MAPLPSAVVPASVAVPLPVPVDDVPESPAGPLDRFGLPVDPANAVVRLPNEVFELPEDSEAAVRLDESWTDVPGLPIEVQPVEETPAEPTDPSDPSEPADPLPSAEPDPTTAPDPGQDPSPAPGDDPDDPFVGEQLPPAEVGDEVSVSLVRPDSLRQGVILLQVEQLTDQGEQEPTPTEEPSPTSSPTPTPSPSTVSPSPSGSPSPTATSSPAVSPSGASSDGPSAAAAPVDEEPVPLGEAVVDVRLDYDDFDGLFGGGWADRLQVVAYPGCYAVTPLLPECSTGVPVEALNDRGAGLLSFTTGDPDAVPADPTDESDLPGGPGEEPTGAPTTAPSTGAPSSDAPSSSPSSSGATSSDAPAGANRVAPGRIAAAAAAGGSGGVVYAVSGGAGSYASNPVAPSSLWQVGVGSGEFTYSYPVEVPPALGGAAPQVGLSYSSASVDGMTLAENGQASQAGLGWSDVASAFITRDYASCSEDGLEGKGDLCWKTIEDIDEDQAGNQRGLVNEFNLVMDGVSSPMVKISGTNNLYRLRDDPGWKIALFQSTSPAGSEPLNADNNNEGFRVTTPDGTEYWFGLGRGGTNSVWTVPVYGNETGEPCYDAAQPAASFCEKQAWRWNLDKVVDTTGNVTRYFYTTETNYYARWANTSEAYRTAYDRAGALARIEYGFDRSTDVARQVVEFTQGRRCTLNMDTNSNPCAGLDNPQNSPNKWPDVPADLICGATASCTVGSPSFFSLNMYKQIVTKTIEATGSGPITRTADTYDLRYAMPDPDGAGPDTADLWLNAISRTGSVFGTDQTLPGVLFDGEALQNRVAPGGGRPYMKFRVDSVRNESGGRIDVVYGHKPGNGCDSTYVNGRDRWASTKECWAARWTPPSGSEPQWEWFHKYVVTRIGLSDDAIGYRLGQAPSEATRLGSLRVYDYDYEGVPAWRFTNSKNVRNTDETWADWRGYQTTAIRTRNIAAQQVTTGDTSVQRVVRYRGMFGTPQNAGSDVWDEAESRLEDCAVRCCHR